MPLPAALDEFHQSFVPSRTASPWDALLDTTGAAAAQIFLWLRLALRASMTSAAILSNPQTEVEFAE